MGVGPFAATDPVQAFAGQLADMRRRIIELELAASLPGAETGTFTPTLSGIAVGTGGGAICTADYSYVPATGLLSTQGKLKFGTSGATLPSSSPVTISLPPGFALADGLSQRYGWCSFYSPVNGTYQGSQRRPNAGPDTVLVIGVQTTSSLSGPSASGPFVWAAGDEIRWNFTAPVVRI